MSESVEINFRVIDEPWPDQTRIRSWADDRINGIKEGLEVDGLLPPPLILFLAPAAEGGWRECMVNLSSEDTSYEEFDAYCRVVIPEMLRELNAFASLTIRTGQLGYKDYEIEEDEVPEETIENVLGPENMPENLDEVFEFVSFLYETRLDHNFEIYKLNLTGKGTVLGERVDDVESLGLPSFLHGSLPPEMLN